MFSYYKKYFIEIETATVSKGQATLSLALDPGQLDPGQEGQARAGSEPILALWYLVVNWFFLLLTFMYC